MATMLFDAQALMKKKLKALLKEASKTSKQQSFQAIEKFERGNRIDKIIQCKNEVIVVLKEGVRTKSANERKLRKEPLGPIVSISNTFS